MKRIVLMYFFLIGIQTSMIAGDDQAIQVDQLPKKARELINTHFRDVKISFAKMDKEIFDTSYDVIFTNGDKIEFDRKGNWTNIKCRAGIPNAIIPARIREYIQEHHPNQKVIDIDYDNREYEVKLVNGIEMKFDKKYRMKGYDD